MDAHHAHDARRPHVDARAVVLLREDLRGDVALGAHDGGVRHFGHAARLAEVAHVLFAQNK